LSNFANHQSLLRLLDGLTTMTGDKKYRKAAQDAAKYALTHLRTSNGLLFWGGHLAWDLKQDKEVYYQKNHELRDQSPYFDLLWKVDAQATRKLLETIWGAHIFDWETLDFNRHGSSVDEPRLPLWEAEFKKDIQVPFPATSDNLSLPITPRMDSLFSNTKIFIQIFPP